MSMKTNNKLIRITTVPISLEKLISGQMAFMGRNGFEVSMISTDFAGKEVLEIKEQAKFIPVNMTRKISPLNDLISLKQLVKVLRNIRPNIVHTHTPKAGLLGMLAAKITGVPIRLHTVAGMPLMEASGLKRLILEKVEKLTYACATKVYPNSNQLKDFIIYSNFAKSNKLKVIGNGSSNGIDTTYFSSKHFTYLDNKLLKEKLHINKHDFIFIFVGRLVGDKGINELVYAFSQLTTPNCKLLLVGAYEEELDALSAKTLNEIENNPHIVAVGFQADVRPYFAISDCLVFPSYREGFPNVVMQAGAMDLPAIVSDINGCNEIIIEGENGTIVPPKNTEDLLTAMLKIYNDVAWRTKMKAKAREMICIRFEQNVVWAAILNEYNSLLDNV